MDLKIKCSKCGRLIKKIDTDKTSLTEIRGVGALILCNKCFFSAKR